MSASIVTIVDYGIGNLLSVQRAVEKCGAKTIVSSDIKTISQSERLILPGVGAFRRGMDNLRTANLIEAVKEFSDRGGRLLGICLGMQLLLDESEEFGKTSGLGLIPGKVISIPKQTIDGLPLKIPHIGWSALQKNTKVRWNKTIFDQTTSGGHTYFTHSFMAIPSQKSHIIAYCNYGGHKITAAIQKDNVVGCQFHPEKSGPLGLKILKNFLLH